MVAWSSVPIWNIEWRVPALLLAVALTSAAEDWPEWRGSGRTGAWTESGVVGGVPEGWAAGSVAHPDSRRFCRPGRGWGPGLCYRLRAQGRTEGHRAGTRAGREVRHDSLDPRMGGRLQGISYPYGPRATPTVDGERVYVVGASGALLCLDARSGAILWRRNYVRDFGTEMPVWGIAGAPLIDGDRLIAIVGGQPHAKVVAMNKFTGEEIWRALPATPNLVTLNPSSSNPTVYGS